MKKWLPLLVILLALAACGPSEEEVAATATQVAANIFATQTAEAPTPTFTPTPTDTPTPTPTPTDTPTPTNTPTPTDTPTPTNTPTPEPTDTPTPAPSEFGEIDAEYLVLTQEDMPAGFLEIPPETMGMTEEDLVFGDTEFDGFFVFADSSFNIYMGLTTVFDDEIEKLGFDFVISNPEFLAEAFATGFTAEADAEFESEPLTDIDDIGEVVSGLTMVTDFEGAPVTVEVVAFSRGNVGAMVFVMSLTGGELELSGSDMARLLDEKIQVGLENAE